MCYFILSDDNKLPESCSCEDGSNITPSTVTSEVLDGRAPTRSTFKTVKRRLKKASLYALG